MLYVVPSIHSLIREEETSDVPFENNLHVKHHHVDLTLQLTWKNKYTGRLRLWYSVISQVTSQYKQYTVKPVWSVFSPKFICSRFEHVYPTPVSDAHLLSLSL